MPNTKSAEKAMRQNKRRRARNLIRSGATKNAIKNYKRAVAGNHKKDAEEGLREVYQKLDKLAKTNVIKKGKADRLKSRLAKKLVMLK